MLWFTKTFTSSASIAFWWLQWWHDTTRQSAVWLRNASDEMNFIAVGTSTIDITEHLWETSTYLHATGIFAPFQHKAVISVGQMHIHMFNPILQIFPMKFIIHLVIPFKLYLMVIFLIIILQCTSAECWRSECSVHHVAFCCINQ